jgi:hypothetical protein
MKIVAEVFLLLACSLSSVVDALLPPPVPGKVIVSPSVAKANLLRLEDDLRAAVDGGAEFLHFSVQDGKGRSHTYR